MQQQIVQLVNTHSIIVLVLVCTIGIPIFVVECWWFVKVFREHWQSVKELQKASRARRRQFSLSMFRLWASIKQSEEWNIDTAEAKQSYNSILESRKEAEQLDTLFFFATAPSVLGLMVCCFTSWINMLVFEISLVLWAVTLVWLVVGLAWYLIRRRVFKVKYAL